MLLPDQSRFLLAYEFNADTGMTDAVVQEVDAQGQVVFQWSTGGLEGESVRPPSDADYAHVNSIQVVGADRDVVVSFRHLSSVYLIATRAHDGYAAGDVIWKLGGRDSTFTFVDDPYGGPCAQHTASILANGHVLLFDDGSGGVFAPHCASTRRTPTGTRSSAPRAGPSSTHSTEDAKTATEVWSYKPTPRYAPFMGSTARLGNGSTLIGWGGSTQALASEVAADGTLLWELRVAPPAPYLSYRASLMHVPDAFAPVVDQVSLADGRVRRRSAGDGRLPLPRRRRLVSGPAAATSGPVAGSTPRPQGPTAAPDRRRRRRQHDDCHPALHGDRVLPAWLEAPRVRASLRAQRVSSKVTLVNDGTYPDAFVIKGLRGNKKLAVRYKLVIVT